METLDQLPEKKRAYVKEKAQGIINEMIRRGVTTDTLATCDARNWDRELHRNMPEIASELSAQGIRVSCSVNWGVTDWRFTMLLPYYRLNKKS